MSTNSQPQSLPKNNPNFDKSISDDRKDKDDFSYLKPDPKDYCFIKDEKGNDVLIFSQIMNQQMIYLRGKIPISHHDQVIKRKLNEIIRDKFYNLAKHDAFGNRQKRQQTFYT